MWIYGSGFPKATDISKQLDKMAGAEREVVGEYNAHRDNSTRKQKTYAGISGEGKAGLAGKKCGGMTPITAPATEHAKLWNGWKSHGLKPAYEPIIVAMKPNDGTYANNAIKWGVSGLNIDGGRIDYESEEDKNSAIPQGRITTKDGKTGVGAVVGGVNNIEIDKEGWIKQNQTGRYPANIILDEEAGKMLDEQSGVSVSPKTYKRKSNALSSENCSLKNIGETTGNISKNFGDKGGASRFFYCAKASKSERNKGCEGLEDVSVHGHYAQDEWSRNNMGNTPDVKRQPTKNNHPTVKPLKLMEYLCTITKTPTGGVVLDPYMGSGTTLVACKKTGRDGIGIEMNEEYIKIAEARTNNS